MKRPALWRRLWVRYRHNGCCPCNHDHGRSVNACWFCFWCQQCPAGDADVCGDGTPCSDCSKESA